LRRPQSRVQITCRRENGANWTTIVGGGEAERRRAECQHAGAKLWYHNRMFEFARKTGGRPIEVLLSRLDCRLISLETDLFWLGIAGENPVNFIRQNAGRIVAVHLKDRQRGATGPRFDIASVPNATYKEVEHGDPLEAIQRSYGVLSKIGS
jgi:sugar phosphate isomerase/epimerase